jgi:putative endopeptidase
VAAYALLALAQLAAYAQDAPTPETHGIVVANMDRSVKPGDDFYRYANGDWIKRTEIPPDRRYIESIRPRLRRLERLDPQAYRWA